MIISASRRTDIPTYYSDWFYNRIKEQYVLVRNPMNAHQVSKIKLSPEVVDCIVFWTKNPKPMIERLDELKDYKYYFQFTLNSYSKDIEENIPSKSCEVIETFKVLSEKIGAEKVIWRYDPIFLNSKYTIEYHVNYFDKLASKLKDYTEKCTISFIDIYKNIKNSIGKLNVKCIGNEEKIHIAQELSKIAFGYGLKMDTCAEDLDLKDLNISHAKCIDDKLIERILGYKLNVVKDNNQRLECGCVSSIDIGMYNTCLNGCKYCYANHNANSLIKNHQVYDKTSPLLCSQLSETDKIKEREIKPLKINQISLFND